MTVTLSGTTVRQFPDGPDWAHICSAPLWAHTENVNFLAPPYLKPGGAFLLTFVHVTLATLESRLRLQHSKKTVGDKCTCSPVFPPMVNGAFFCQSSSATTTGKFANLFRGAVSLHQIDLRAMR